jgi:hypothetical protein
MVSRFAQAWRKRTTVPYTRNLARACQSFTQNPQYPSDVLIAPLVQLNELMCRVSDYFSYDNVEEAELHGETILDLSTKNFSAEHQRMRDAMSESIAQNGMCTLASQALKLTRTVASICLHGNILDVMIYECSFHYDVAVSAAHASTLTQSLSEACAYSSWCSTGFTQSPSLSHLVGLFLFNFTGHEDCCPSTN